MTTTTRADGPPEAPNDKLDAEVLKISAVVVLGAIMSILDITVVSVALRPFMTIFDTSYANVAWTMTAYTLALATVIPLTGWAADRFGTKRLYILALVLFVAGSVLCAAAWDIGSLIAFRAVQGFGGGMLMPLGMTILRRAAGPERMGRVMAVLGIPMLLGPISGPILGGWLIDDFSWHWIFLINLPIGVVAFFAALRILPRDEPTPSESFDFVGMLLLSPGLALVLFGVSSIPETGTVASTRVLASVVVGTVLIVAFVFHAFRPEHPLIDLRLFKTRSLTVATIAMMLFATAFFGAGLLFPTYFQQVRGEDTLHAGLLLAPQGLGAMVTMPLAGVLADRIPIGRIVPVGLAAILAGMAVFTQIGGDTSYWVLGGALFVMGLGMGATMMPIMTSAFQGLPEHDIARGSTMLNITQQVATSVGTAVFSVLLTNGMADEFGSEAGGSAEAGNDQLAQMPPAMLDAFREAAAGVYGDVFWVGLGLVAVTLIPVWFMPRRRSEVPETEPGAERPVMMH